VVQPIQGKLAGVNPVTPQQAKLKEVAHEFEAVFLELFLKQARSSAKALGGESNMAGKDIYEGWQDESLATAISSGSGIGLAEVLYRELQQQQVDAKNK
jgi:flagellar protein FlgJ